MLFLVLESMLIGPIVWLIVLYTISKIYKFFKWFIPYGKNLPLKQKICVQMAVLFLSQVNKRYCGFKYMEGRIWISPKTPGFEAHLPEDV